MKIFVPTLLALAVFSASTFAQDVPESATDSFWRNDGLIKALTDVKSHTLTNIRKKPEAYRGLTVRMEIQFHDSRKNCNPFFTRFTNDNFASFAAWGGEQALWKREEYQNDFAFFFVSRNTTMIRTILECDIYHRLQVDAVVRDVFRGIPYIEIMKAELCDDSVTEATIIAAAKAEKASEEGDTATALAEYERAMRGDLSPILKAQMYCDVANVYIRRGDRENALDRLDKAQKLQPNNKDFAKAIEKASKEPLPVFRPVRKPESESVASRPATDKPENASASKKDAAAPSAAGGK
jgi:tetratricopeptide (TPR) repeat protein